MKQNWSVNFQKYMSHVDVQGPEETFHTLNTGNTKFFLSGTHSLEKSLDGMWSFDFQHIHFVS